MRCFYVIQLGFEPKTYCLEGSCSIQLSYWTRYPINNNYFIAEFQYYPASVVKLSETSNFNGANLAISVNNTRDFKHFLIIKKH